MEPIDVRELVAKARREAFIGRTDEIADFERALAGGGRLLYVHGPGGVGKTTLLRQFVWLTERAGRTAIWVDARDLGARTPAPAVLTGGRDDAVLLVDTAELLAPLDRWISEETVAGLPDGTVVVVASREPVPLPWRVDPGWRRMLTTVALANFSPAEAARFLTGQHVPAAEQAPMIAFTRGHPLALALVADARTQRGGALPDPACADVVTGLLDVLLGAVTEPTHRAAIEACALVRVTTEPLLAALLDVADARELFDWLRSLSVVELGRRGIAPHDVIRDALAAELGWRHPDRHQQLRRRATTYYRASLGGLDSVAEKRDVLLDVAFVHRDHPIVGRGLSALSPDAAPAAEDRFTVETARPGDAAEVRAMVARHEGEASAALAEHWRRRQPANCFVVRDGLGGTVGYLQLVSLAEVSDEDGRTDPAIAAATAYLAGTPAPGRAATLVRFWLGRDSYQDFSPVQTAITLHIIEHSLTTPDLTVTLTACARPDDWAPIAAHTFAARVPSADFTVDGRTAAVFAHDWRALPPVDWLAVVTGLEPPPVPGQRPDHPSESTVDVPVETTGPVPAQFAEAVRSALRDFNRVDRLGESALLTSRLVADTCASASNVDRARALQQVIRSAAGQLAESPRDVGAVRALHHTYLQPAGTQRRARDLLDLPTSTYRRYLAAGVEHLTAILWQRECDAVSAGRA